MRRANPLGWIAIAVITLALTLQQAYAALPAYMQKHVVLTRAR